MKRPMKPLLFWIQRVLCILFASLVNRKSQTIIIFLSIISCGFQAGGPSIPWQKALSYRTSDLHPITIGKYGFPYVAVSVNGQKLNLVWDTGNMSGLVLNSDIAARMSLPVIGDNKSYESSGQLIGMRSLARDLRSKSGEKGANRWLKQSFSPLLFSPSPRLV